MRKIIPLVLLALLWVMPSCDDGGDDDKDKESSGASLTVTVNYLGNYDGDYDTDSGKAGTQQNFVQLYSCDDMPIADTLPTSIDDDDTNVMTDYLTEYVLDVENNTPKTISGITPGDYYVIAFFDYRTGGVDVNTITRGDRYVFYNGSTGTGSPLKDEAQKLTITKSGPNEISLEIQPQWEMDNSKYFITGVTGDTMTINYSFSDTNFNGLDAYFYVYGQLDPGATGSPRNNILYKGNLTLNADLSTPQTGSITITNVLHEYRTNFYVVLLVDYNGGGQNTINQDDYYVIYNGVMVPDGTSESSVAYNDTISMDDSSMFQLLDGSVWDDTP